MTAGTAVRPSPSARNASRMAATAAAGETAARKRLFVEAWQAHPAILRPDEGPAQGEQVS